MDTDYQPGLKRSFIPQIFRVRSLGYLGTIGPFASLGSRIMILNGLDFKVVAHYHSLLLEVEGSKLQYHIGATAMMHGSLLVGPKGLVRPEGLGHPPS